VGWGLVFLAVWYDFTFIRGPPDPLKEPTWLHIVFGGFLVPSIVHSVDRLTSRPFAISSFRLPRNLLLDLRLFIKYSLFLFSSLIPTYLSPISPFLSHCGFF